MVFGKLPTKAKSNRRGRRGGKRRGGRKARDVPDIASCSVKRSMTTPQNTQFSSNVMYSLMNTQLTDYPRAVQIAKAYQHYRIKKVTLTFKPSYDTFAAGDTKPRLYYMIDKSGAVSTNVNIEGLKGMGAKPKDLDEKSLVISWRPSVLESVMYAGGGVGASSASKYTISPWLTTNAAAVDPGLWVASGIDHLGLYWYVDQVVNASGYQYSIECEVQFEFKKPLNVGSIGSSTAVPCKVAELNDSPDGIVGGSDGI